MRRADVLAIAQSTFSLSAAMLARPETTPARADAPAGHARAVAGPKQRVWRPEPATGALVPCDPWDAPVLLNACGSGTAFRKADAARASSEV